MRGSASVVEELHYISNADLAALLETEKRKAAMIQYRKDTQKAKEKEVYFRKQRCLGFFAMLCSVSLFMITGEAFALLLAAFGCYIVLTDKRLLSQ